MRKQAHIVVKRVSDRRCKHVTVGRASLGGSILLAKKLFDPSTILHFSLRSDYGLAPSSARAPRFWAGMLTVGRTARRPAVLGRPPATRTTSTAPFGGRGKIRSATWAPGGGGGKGEGGKEGANCRAPRGVIIGKKPEVIIILGRRGGVISGNFPLSLPA